MYFDLTDEQKAIRDEVVGLLRDYLPQDRLVPKFDAGALDGPLWEALNGLGLGTVMVPAEAGGLELGLLTLAVVADALGEAAAAVPTINNALAAWLIAVAGNEAQRERWLSRLLAGETIAAFALAEPGGGWQFDDWRLSGPVLNGAKAYVEWGMEAGLFIVGMDGGALGLVDGLGASVTRTPIDPVDRTRPLADIAFAGSAVEPIGADGLGARLADALLVLLAADACGAAGRALDLAVDYAKQRTQFDRLIGSFQGLKHQLANSTAEIAPCRPLHWYAAHAWDTVPEKRSYAASLAKAHITDVAVRVSRLAVEMHGGIGYTWEYPLHIFLKRAMFDREAMGLPTVHRARAANAAGW